MTKRTLHATAILGWVLAAPLLSAPASLAASYEGSGDTGWVHTDKTACCDAAIEDAVQASIRACRTAGGAPEILAPEVMRGTRGDCQWEAVGDLADRRYRCTATTNIHCR